MNINIMVVEDNAKIREGYKELLIDEASVNYGTQANVDLYANSDAAIKRLLEPNKPMFDLLFTDIDLAGSPNPNRAGIYFARYAKKTLPEVPVVGCSGYFSDSDLVSEEKEFFDAWWPKGSSFRNLDKMFNDAIKRAIECKQKRIAISECLYIQTPETEEQFKSEGYRKETLSPNSENKYVKSFEVWVKESEDGCEIEVVDCPALIAWGDEYAQALEVLDELIDGYRDLLDAPDHLLSPSMWQARAFIRKLLNSSTLIQEKV